MKYPPRKLQAVNIPYITLEQYQLFEHIRSQLKDQGVKFSLPGAQ